MTKNEYRKSYYKRWCTNKQGNVVCFGKLHLVRNPKTYVVDMYQVSQGEIKDGFTRYPFKDIDHWIVQNEWNLVNRLSEKQIEFIKDSVPYYLYKKYNSKSRLLSTVLENGYYTYEQRSTLLQLRRDYIIDFRNEIK